MIIENPRGVALRIVVLTVPDGPPEGGQAGQGEQERERREQQDDGHRRPPVRFIRNALRVTTSDEPDMATAATSGLTRPKIAAGAATTVCGCR